MLWRARGLAGVLERPFDDCRRRLHAKVVVIRSRRIEPGEPSDQLGVLVRSATAMRRRRRETGRGQASARN